MKATAVVEDQRNVQITVSVTLRLEEWDRLRDQLSCSVSPSFKMRLLIEKVIAAVTGQVTEQIEYES